MIDALAPALAAWLEGGIQAAAAAAMQGAKATATMTKARAGRSAYVNAQNLSGVQDPGARAVELTLTAMANAG